MNAFRVRELRDETVTTFAVSHSLPITSAVSKGQNEPAGFFYSPLYMFVPSKLKHLEGFELPWAYSVWHELVHAEDSSLCNLGIYEGAIDSLSEELADYGLYLISKKRPTEGLKWIGLSMELVTKLSVFHEVSKVSKEVAPTYLQLSQSTRKMSAKFAYQLLTRFFPNSKATESDMIELAENIGERLLGNVNSANRARHHGMTTEHTLALLIGNKIRENYGDVNYVRHLPLHCMNIDLRDVDLVGVATDKFRHLMLNSHLDPDKRLIRTSTDRRLLRQLEMMEKNQGTAIAEEPLRIFSHSSLPRFLRAKFGKVIRLRIERGKRKTANVESAQELMKDQKLFVSREETGDLFFILPLYVGPGKANAEKFAQSVLSKSYAFELLMRCLSARKRYTDDLMSCMRSTLMKLHAEILQPEVMHLAAEIVVRNNCSTPTLRRQAPFLMSGKN